MTVKSEPKKRGRKAKKTTDNSTPTAPKKRGRKPKGGKIIENTKITIVEPPQKPNVIVHLKCNSKDINLSLDHEFIQNNNNNNGGIQSYNFDSNKNNDLQYQLIKNNETKSIKEDISISDVSDDENNSFNYKMLNLLKNYNTILKIITFQIKNLHVFGVLMILITFYYIPKYEINGNYNVYGCFVVQMCNAHLMEENIDDSSKFEDITY